MARARQAKLSKFDPSELEDLIFSPAVGNGTSSHLLGDYEHTSRLSTVDQTRATTVDIQKQIAQTQEDNYFQIPTLVPSVEINRGPITASTVVPSNESTVDSYNSLPILDAESSGKTPARYDRLSTVDPLFKPTVDSQQSPEKGSLVIQMSTVDPIYGSTVDSQLNELWYTEDGQPVRARQVRRIVTAQDTINAYEESVYNVLWNTRQVAESGDPESRLVQAGYDFLCKRTRLAKKSIQRVVARLLEKDFLAIETPADIYARTSTVYRVRSYRQVLKMHTARGREYVAKIGIGMSYVHRTTVDPKHISTVVRPTTVTVDPIDRSTVVYGTTYIDRPKKATDTTTLQAAIDTLHPGLVDAGAAERIWRSCRLVVPDVTPAEIAKLFSAKIQRLQPNRRIANPVGVMLTSVTDWFGAVQVQQMRQERDKVRIEAVASYRQLLAEFPNHEEVPQWQQALEALLAQ